MTLRPLDCRLSFDLAFWWCRSDGLKVEGSRSPPDPALDLALAGADCTMRLIHSGSRQTPFSSSSLDPVFSRSSLIHDETKASADYSREGILR